MSKIRPDSLPEKILFNPDSPAVPRLEKEIDALIYDLYKLTPDEIAIVEDRYRKLDKNGQVLLTKYVNKIFD